MIEGIQFDVTSDELKTHLIKRAEHHKEKAEFYATKGVEFKNVLSEEERELKMSSSNSAPESEFLSRAKRHRVKASLMGFMAGHLIPNEVYRFTENDLGRLELTESEY